MCFWRHFATKKCDTRWSAEWWWALVSHLHTLTDSLHYLCCLRSGKNCAGELLLSPGLLFAGVSQAHASPVCLLSYEVTQSHIYVTPSFFHGWENRSASLYQKRWIQYFRGHFMMSTRPLPSAVHAWHDGSEGKVVISRAAMIVFECTRPRSSAQPGGSHASIPDISLL